LVGAADRRLALARTLGADAIVDARSEDVAARLRREFGGSLPSVVIDASGNPDAIRTAIAVTAPGGRLILQGFCGAQRIHEFTVDPVIVNDLTVIGALGSPGIWPDVIRLIESGRINPSALVTDELPIASFAEGIRRLRLREAVKVVLRSDTEDAWK
jgi:threonine dehydrogenase-like Zn-dependent dehydrogenase